MTPASLEGQMLGKYQVLEPLGGGGMARVYRAYHPQLDRYVAIKALRPDLVEDAEFLARFRREARSVAALRHPNIVQVFDFDVQDDVYYMVMELLEGNTLKAHLAEYSARGEAMPLGEVIRITLDVLDGLAYAHNEGMVHRDIKPANILLSRRGEAVLADFGIAQIVGATRHTVSGALLGTLHYMAPEQGLKGQADERSDLYSLGVVLYEMLTQHTPFEADTPLALLMKHLNDPLPLPLRQGEPLPSALERVLLKALSKEPADRYQNAREMAQALRDAAAMLEVDLTQPLSFLPTGPAGKEGAVPKRPSASRAAAFVADEAETLREAGKRLLGAVGAVASEAMGKASTALQQAAAEVRRGEDRGRQPIAAIVDEEGRELAEKTKQRKGGAALLSALWVFVLGNLCLFSAAFPASAWSIYTEGWPIQILLVALTLSAAMHLTSSIWLLIPTGLVFGAAILLASGQWTDIWGGVGHPWLFAAWIAVASIGLALLLFRYRELARFVARLLALLLAMASLAAILAVGMRVNLYGLLFDLISRITP